MDERAAVRSINIKTNGHSPSIVNENNIFEKEFTINGDSTNLTNKYFTNGTYNKTINSNMDSNGKTENSYGAKENDIEIKTIGEEVPGSLIQEYYKGKSVLITGVTGFVGKVLLERLLVLCPGLEIVYVIIREKQGHSASTRLEKLFQDPVYSVLTDKMKSKVYMMVGDIGTPMLGLSNEDYQTLTDKVNIVMHCAANVRFDSGISELIKVNVKGTCDLLELSKNMKNLISFVYVSTIYAYCTREGIMLERVYNPGLDIDVALGLVNIEPDDAEILQIINGKILQTWPNTYSFTKAIAENAVVKMGKGLPTCIFRPGLVTSTTYKHPVPGYTDNTNGTMSYLLAAAMGAVNILPGYNNKNARTLPADYCANAILACSWDTANKISNPDPKVYNYVPEDEYAWDLECLLQRSIRHMREEPYDAMYGYPMCIFTSNLLFLKVAVLILHVIPGLFGDIGRRLIGKKPLYVKACQRLLKHTTLGFFFATESLEFKVFNCKVLFDKMCSVDKTLFKLNLDDYCPKKNIPILIKGAKKYILKQEAEASEEAKKKLRRFKVYLFISMSFYTALGLFLMYHLLRVYLK